MSGSQLALTLPEPVEDVELVDGDVVEGIAEASVAVPVLSHPAPPTPPGLEERNLFAEAQRIAARAASASTRRQYGAIFAPSTIGSPLSSAERPWSAISMRT